MTIPCSNKQRSPSSSEILQSILGSAPTSRILTTSLWPFGGAWYKLSLFPWLSMIPIELRKFRIERISRSWISVFSQAHQQFDTSTCRIQLATWSLLDKGQKIAKTHFCHDDDSLSFVIDALGHCYFIHLAHSSSSFMYKSVFEHVLCAVQISQVAVQGYD